MNWLSSGVQPISCNDCLCSTLIASVLCLYNVFHRLDVDSCEAEYLKDTLSMTFPQTAVSVNLYD